MTRRLTVALLSAGICTTAAAGGINMQPGLWEITTEVDMPGMPMKMPPQTIRHCYTEQELAEAQNTVPQGGNSDCKVTDYKLKGNTATWTIECTGQQAMRGTGTMTTHPTSYTGSMKSVMQGPGGTMEMTNHWRAKRIGDCN
jgi:hypothetical protein